jgi:hypothetical protein
MNGIVRLHQTIKLSAYSSQPPMYPYITVFLYFFPSSEILKNNRKHYVLETGCFRPQVRRRHVLHDWTTYVLLTIVLWLYSPVLDLGRFLSFLIYIQSVGLPGRGIGPPQGLYLHTEQHKYKNKRIQTSMPRVGL